VVLSAVVSAAHYFQMFWSQINTRVEQRQRRTLVIESDKKPQDVPTR
jgi:hypothetical protein